MSLFGKSKNKKTIDRISQLESFLNSRMRDISYLKLDLNSPEFSDEEFTEINKKIRLLNELLKTLKSLLASIIAQDPNLEDLCRKMLKSLDKAQPLLLLSKSNKEAALERLSQENIIYKKTFDILKENKGTVLKKAA